MPQPKDHSPVEATFDDPDSELMQSRCYMKTREQLENADWWSKVFLKRYVAIRKVWDNAPLSLAVASFSLILAWFSNTVGLPGMDTLFTLPLFRDTILEVTAPAGLAVLAGIFGLLFCYRPKKPAFLACAIGVLFWWAVSVVYLIDYGKWGVFGLAASPTLLSVWAIYLWFRGPSAYRHPE